MEHSSDNALDVYRQVILLAPLSIHRQFVRNFAKMAKIGEVWGHPKERTQEKSGKMCVGQKLLS